MPVGFHYKMVLLHLKPLSLLLSALIAIIFFYPFVEGADRYRYIFDGRVTVTFFLALYEVIDHSHHFRIAFIFPLPAMILLWIRTFPVAITGMIIGSALTSILFSGVIIAMTVHGIFTTRQVNRDTIYGAVCV